VARDPFDDGASLDPGVSELISALTGPPTQDELAGQHAAIAMFTTVRDAQMGPAPAPAGPPEPIKRRSFRAGTRLAAAATVVALAGGFAAAGYAAVLPSPIQHVAHQLLGFAGVPDSPKHVQKKASLRNPGPSGSVISPGAPHHHRTSSASPTPSPTATSPRPRPTHSKSPSPHPTSPSPSSSAHPVASHVTITASQQQITAGASVQFSASLTSRGQPEPGVTLTLLGQPGGRANWRVVGHQATNAQGQATFTVPTLPFNATFRVTGSRGLRSAPVSVVVIPVVSARAESGPRKRAAVIVVAVPYAQHGNLVELEALTRSGQWKPIRLHRLHKGKRAAFEVVTRKVAVTYQVVLFATPRHGQSVSPEVTVPARPAG
jgi:hypothetical protein